MQKNQEKQPRKRGTLETVACIFTSIVMMLATIPLGRVYCGSDDFSFYVFVFFLVWLFGVVPIIFLYMRRREDEAEALKARKAEEIEEILKSDVPWSC